MPPMPGSKLISTAGRAVSKRVDSNRKGFAQRSRVSKVVTQRHNQSIPRDWQQPLANAASLAIGS